MNALLNAPTPADYLWAPDVWWRHDKYPGINNYNNKLATHFAIDAIEAQPLDYLRVVARDVMLVFVQNDRPLTKSTMSFTVTPHLATLPSYYAADEYRYAGTRSNTYLVQPFAYFLLLYQQPVYFTGLDVPCRRGGRTGRRDQEVAHRAAGRIAALPWALAAASIVLPGDADPVPVPVHDRRDPAGLHRRWHGVRQADPRACRFAGGPAAPA